MDAAAPPSTTSPDSPDLNALLDEARIPLALKAASIALGAAGLVVALLGVQNLTLVHWSGGYVMVPIALLALGATGIGVAAKVVRGRAWALAASVVSSLLLALGTSSFVVLATLSGLFSMLIFMGLAAAVTSVVLTMIAIGPFRRLIATRRRLREAGFDLDL